MLRNILSIFLNRIIYEIIRIFAIVVLDSGKSTPINYIKAAMSQLIELFPDLYNKKINTNEKVIKMKSDVTTDSDDNNTFNDTQFDTMDKKKSHAIDSN